MSITCGKIFTGGRVKERRMRLKNHNRDRHEKFEIHAQDSSMNVSSDAFTSTFQKHNVHRIKIPEIKTSTLRSEALQSDLKKMKQRFAKDLTDDNNYQEHDLSSLFS